MAVAFNKNERRLLSVISEFILVTICFLLQLSKTLLLNCLYIFTDDKLHNFRARS